MEPMSRKRSIHPKLFTDEKFVSLSMEARCLLLALGTYSDYADRFRVNIPMMQSRFKSWFDLDAWEELLDCGFVTVAGGIGTINFAYGFPRKTISKWEAIRSFIFERDGFSCTYCGSEKDLHCDHVHPKSKGGDEAPGNLTTACKSCNLSKGDKTLTEWMASR
jgi:HNH endonuclease